MRLRYTSSLHSLVCAAAALAVLAAAACAALAVLRPATPASSAASLRPPLGPTDEEIGAVDPSAPVLAPPPLSSPLVPDLAAPPATAPAPGPAGPGRNAKSLPIEALAPSARPATAPAAPQDAGLLPLYQPFSRQPGLPIPSPGGFVPGPSDSDPAAIVALIEALFPPDQVEGAKAVARCESHMTSKTSPPNRNGTRDHGVFQLNDGGTLQGLLTRMGEDPANIALALDPEWNVRAALRLFGERGWQPWTCARKVGLV